MDLCQFEAKWLYFQIQKKKCKMLLTVLAVELFIKRCDNFEDWNHPNICKSVSNGSDSEFGKLIIKRKISSKFYW